MPLYLFFRSAESDRNPVQVHSALVDAADEPTARQIMREGEPFPSMKTGAWSSAQVAPMASLPAGRNPVWFQGDCPTMLGRFRGQ